ncbi:unnamed protein product, partial [Closterium sp. NIES-65]
SCEAVVRNVAAMESDFALLHKTISTTATTTPAADAKRKRKEALYALGSRVKYLVDTPEKIWGCLDERMFLEAAQRFMRAWEVHQLLSPSLGSKGAAAGGGAGGGGGGDGAAAGGWQAQQQGLMASFPLLRHQWPLVETFRTQIVERSRECLHDASRIPAAGVGEYAAALAAVAVMEELSSHDLLSLFLNARRACLRSQWPGVSEKEGIPQRTICSTSFLTPVEHACAPRCMYPSPLPPSALGDGGSLADGLVQTSPLADGLVQTSPLPPNPSHPLASCPNPSHARPTSTPPCCTLPLPLQLWAPGGGGGGGGGVVGGEGGFADVLAQTSPLPPPLIPSHPVSTPQPLSCPPSTPPSLSQLASATLALGAGGSFADALMRTSPLPPPVIPSHPFPTPPNPSHARRPPTPSSLGAGGSFADALAALLSQLVALIQVYQRQEVYQ